ANQFKTASMKIGAAIQQATGKTDAQLAREFKSLATEWQNDLSRLQTLKPPAKVQATFNTLSGAAGRAEADLNAIVSAAETHSKSAAEQASATLVTDVVAAKSASQSIDKALANGS